MEESIFLKEVVLHKEMDFLRTEEEAILEIMKTYRENITRLKIEELTLKSLLESSKDDMLVTEGTIPHSPLSPMSPLSPKKETPSVNPRNTIIHKRISKMKSSETTLQKPSVSSERDEAANSNKESIIYLCEDPLSETQMHISMEDMNVYNQCLSNIGEISSSDFGIEPITDDAFNATQGLKDTYADMDEANQSILSLDVDPNQNYLLKNMEAIDEIEEDEQEIIDVDDFDDLDDEVHVLLNPLN